MRRQKRREGVERRWLVMGVVVSALVLGLLGGGGLLMIGGRDSKVRKVCVEKFSMVVDRMDELGQAWKTRSVPQVRSPLLREEAAPQAQRPAAPLTSPSATPPSGPGNPAPPAAPALKPPSHPDDISSEDQQQLNSLFQKLQTDK